MAFDPVPAHQVANAGLIQYLPQIGIFHRLFVRCFPAIHFPLWHPLQYTLAHVLGIGVHVDAAALLQRIQPFDNRSQLHAVVGGVQFTATQFFGVVARL